MIKKIALLGANSHVGKGLISEILRLRTEEFAEMDLYARDPYALTAWMKAEFQCEKSAHHPDAFGKKKFDIVINAIGVSDFARIAEIGSQVFHINRHYDERVMSYLDTFPSTKYVYISSGAVYGGKFQEPATCDTQVRMSLNTPTATDWYGLAKFSSEIHHRSKNHLAIVDIRIFGYVSSWLPTDKPFFLSDVANALIQKIPLQSDQTDFWRDYIGPSELFQAVQCIIDTPPINTSVDVYSASPITKYDLLNALVEHFSLVVEHDTDLLSISPATNKLNYYSTDRRVEKLGYFPKRTSEVVVLQELSKFLFKSTKAGSNV